jgi:protein dithiol:quinone oxidoreductase
MREPGAGGWLIGAVVVPLLAVAAAYVSQHRFDMLPCPWCTLQRLIFMLIALAALLALLLRGALPRRLFAGLGLLLAGCGIAAALWQHFVAAASASCNLTLADRILSGLGLDAAWPEMFVPMATCADAAVNLLGVPYAYWSLGVFVLLAIAMLRVLRAPG